MGVRIPPPLPPIRGEIGAVGFVSWVREFIREALVAFRKVTWPSRQELVNSTTVVIVLTIVLALFLGRVDIGLARIVERILRGAERRCRRRTDAGSSSTRTT